MATPLATLKPGSRNLHAPVHHKLIITLAARHKLPAVYPSRSFAVDGGLISYAPDEAEMYRQAAGYVDRILRGENAADLPVQAPTKYETVLNMKTAEHPASTCRQPCWCAPTR
jgi:putative ABC transport system substrate-binding protein